MTLTTAKRFTIAEYHRLTELGFFTASDRLELIRGEIVNMAAKGTAHEVSITRLVRSLFKIIGDRATLHNLSSKDTITMVPRREPRNHYNLSLS